MALLLRGAHLSSQHTQQGRETGCGLVEDWVVLNRQQHGLPAVEERKRDKEPTPQCDSSYSSGERTNKRERKNKTEHFLL